MYKSTFMGLNTALRGVLAQQTALDVTGHNISNIDTQGYSRQRAELSTSPQWSSAALNSQQFPGQLGTGVEVSYLERLRDQYIDQSVRQQLGRQGMQQTLVDQLAQVESAFQEPGDNGINAKLNAFWSSMDQVASNPSSIEARNSFLSAADQLASAFRQLDTDLSYVQNQSDARLNDTVTQINSITGQIAALNKEIGKAVVRGQQPNDLLDTRDKLLDDLSKIANFTYQVQPYDKSLAIDHPSNLYAGQITINFGPTMGNLVDPASANGFTSIVRNNTLPPPPGLDQGLAAGDIINGRAFADYELSRAGGVIDSIKTQLDTLASTIITQINTAQASGFDLSGAAGATPIFNGVSASTFALNPAITAQLLAASGTVGPGEEGNGANFRNILGVVRATGYIGGATFDGYYSSIVSGVGTKAASEQKKLSNADALVQLANDRRTQVSGVSLDEEMSNMLRFQHAYNASARVLTTMDEAIDTIINRMGRVGL